jgi:predicted 3-demethylubiquinone-9 3-methyltransferase (glyoxalase superfamily)
LEKTLDRQNQVLNLIAGELSIAIKQVKNTISLLEEQSRSLPVTERNRQVHWMKFKFGISWSAGNTYKISISVKKR